MLKTILCLIVAIFHFQSHASLENNDISIYNALSVEPVILYPNRTGIFIQRKELGGLTCYLETGVHPRAVEEAFCELADEINAELIFESIEAEEIYLAPQADGTKVIEKSVDRLYCQKLIPVHPNYFAHYSCEMTL